MVKSTLASFREVTGLQRPPHDHGCKPVEVFPGVWTAHFHDVEDAAALTAISPEIRVVVNCATEKCPTKEGSYGSDVKVIRVEGLLDDPDARKKVDALPEGAEKEAAKAALPQFPPEECAGDAKKDFEEVVGAMIAAKAAGGASLVHCYASLSRSVAFILAYAMKTQSMSAVDAAKQMKTKWSATWPNDTFVKQLLEYEEELASTGSPAEVEMKVTTKKPTGFYVNAAKTFFTGLETKDGTKREPVCVLHISGLGEAINTAVAAATAVESAGLGTIQKVQTSYPEMQVQGMSRGCPRVSITLYHK